MDWLLCLLSQHADGVWHPLDAWRPLRTKKSKDLCCHWQRLIQLGSLSFRGEGVEHASDIAAFLGAFLRDWFLTRLCRLSRVLMRTGLLSMPRALWEQKILCGLLLLYRTHVTAEAKRYFQPSILYWGKKTFQKWGREITFTNKNWGKILPADLAYKKY